MAKTMTPSAEMTDGQINKAVELYRAMLEKHRKEFGSEAVQQVLGQPDFVGEMVGVLRKRVEAVSDMIVRHVKVNRAHSPRQCLEATGRRLYADDSVVETMPCGDGEDVEVVFFRVGRFISDADLDKEYGLRGLKPADPYSLAQANIDDPALADDRPNGTHWKDTQGKWCYAAFCHWHGERYVNVNRDDVVAWSGHWWFAGLRK